MEKQLIWGPVTCLQKSTMQEDTVKECQATTYRVYLTVHCSYYRHQTVGCWLLDTEGVTLQHQQHQNPSPLRAA